MCPFHRVPAFPALFRKYVQTGGVSSGGFYLFRFTSDDGFQEAKSIKKQLQPRPVAV
jgi:hypothetical protein